MVEGGIAEDGPLIQPVEHVSTATLVGLCSGAGFLVCAVAMTWWLCRRRRGHTKLATDKSLAFRPPHRKPTAVKSPGNQGHYLKKSPSPTGPAKGPPGTNSGSKTPSPTGPSPTGLPQGKEFGERNGNIRALTLYKKYKLDGSTPIQSPTGAEANLTIENERDKAELENSEKCERNGEAPGHVIQLGGPGHGLGQIVFKLRYVVNQIALVVTLVECKDLLSKEQQNVSCDPYIKLQLLPDKHHHAKSRVFRNTRDPVYNEDFTFYGVPFAKLQKISLHFVVMSFDKYSRDQVIGEVWCPLSSVPAEFDIVENNQTELCQEICPRNLKIQSQGRGELLVSLCWQPAASKLTVVVLKARDLPQMDVTGLADPYVKIYLLYNGQRVAKRKTHVKKRTLDPIFNESIVFEIPAGAEDLSKISLEFAVLDWDRVTRNEVIGRVEIGGSKCQGSAQNHWLEVCNSPKRQIADWHKLRE